MAKKISKHSRAARRSELEIDTEVKSLENLPRAEKTDLSNILIRTAAKNEALLDAKIQKKQDRKKFFKEKYTKKALENKLLAALNNEDKDRLEHALNITNRLDGKVSKSIARAKYVQNSRKANWDQTNKVIKRKLKGDSILDKTEMKKNDDDEELDDEPFDDDEEENRNKKTIPQNMFGLLSTDVEE
ncbi:similar to Saccharomyces cerevisiae YAL059W ECM1 Pre-ribosomal factor involved in 60S ribosomal protein subunit export [Maudiozyma barnettii]|uniref:Similar to Saccharomyces cerevisiae YAL059W ECM1 Pre-ribosomal factor involved in 60S ribosomal protein subunit export n=1 Tax=Maudiozyma barnettii TaxID=61262 RepID=A0A8H2VJQ7_9SACH|nr:Ecm1p [Kazachstania barnettii]CAB4257036.1 similar to Saccharomyces cerevisiae YAL059W ECM1 Pre-ribosomal factor involved in 60S ribosomal protein subunit export [Kazachstania barnettii]CAD1779407.1 similar to Saccharomyces cerevisiae YAL059W ECM1 Pre-ribosomal factor involved in 60S ribosomal protein subunit export [Kazachstania barnettii]